MIREIRFPNGQNSNQCRRHKFVLSSSSLVQRLNFYSFPEREQHNNETLCLSLSLLRSHRHACANCVLCVRFSLSNVRDKSACSPPQKEGRKNYYLGCIQNPKLRERNARPFLSSSSEHFLVVIYIITINDNMSTTSASLFNNNSSCVYAATVTTTRSSIISQRQRRSASSSNACCTSSSSRSTFSFPRGGGSSSFTRASGCRDASSSSSSSSSRERRKNSTNYRINSYSGLNKTNNEVYARSMGSYYSRAKTFAENVLEQTMSFTKGKKRVATMMPIGVPRVPYKTPGENMWQWVDIWNCLYRERLIWIGQNIDDELGNQLVATMLFLDNLDSTKPMYLYINTEGGQVVPTMAIMDTMNHAKSKVGTVAFGSARAMGGLLLTNGEKGMRAALPNTCVMLHHPSGVARGAASDVQNEGRELLNIREKINKVVAKNCNQDIELVRKTINRDKHFTAEQAQDWGIIDKVLYRTRK